jgi:hypothetical protein
MTTKEMNKVVTERAKLMLQDSKIQELYQAHKTEAEAKDWILHQALITLMYSHEERVEMAKKKNAA